MRQSFGSLVQTFHKNYKLHDWSVIVHTLIPLIHSDITVAVLHGWLYDTFAPPNWVRAVLYVVTWVLMLAGVVVLFVFVPRRKKTLRWTTQDIFVLSILSVLLLAWDSFLNDQLFGPIVSAIPIFGNLLNWIQLPDLPYMFIVVVAVVTIRKPGTVTALIFIKRVLGEIMFSTHGLNVLNWPDALDEGVITDLYILWRGEYLLSSVRSIVIDGFIIGALRAVPNTIIGDAVLDPFLNGQVHTWASFIGTNIAGGGGILGNGIGNGLEVVLTAPLAIRVGRSLGIVSGGDRSTGDRGTTTATSMSTQARARSLAGSSTQSTTSLVTEVVSAPHARDSLSTDISALGTEHQQNEVNLSESDYEGEDR